MEHIKIKDPKNREVLNQDSSVTNDNEGNDAQATVTDQPEKTTVLITDNDTPGQPGSEATSNKGQGPSGENL